MFYITYTIRFLRIEETDLQIDYNRYLGKSKISITLDC
jgi:hypothetical protein